MVGSLRDKTVLVIVAGRDQHATETNPARRIGQSDTFRTGVTLAIDGGGALV